MADNLVLGRGKLYFTPYAFGTTTGGTRGYFGNTPQLSIAQSNTKLDHYSAEGGLKVKDRSIVLQTDLTITFDCDNINNGNLALWFGGNDSDALPSDAPGDIGAMVVIGRQDTIFGALTFEADNPVGDNKNYWFPYVNLSPNGNFALKGDTWQQMSFTAEALKRDNETQRVYVYEMADGSSVAPDDDTPEFEVDDIGEAGSGSGGGGGGAPVTGGTLVVPAAVAHLISFEAYYTLTGGTSGYVRLHATGGFYGEAMHVSGANGYVGPFVIKDPATYTLQLFPDSATAGTALVTSAAIVVS